MIRDGHIIAFYLFDVAESVNLSRVAELCGGSAVPARLAPKPATPDYIQYDKPPLSFEGEVVGVADVKGFKPRFRVYDYGVISLSLTRPFSGSWSDLQTFGQALIDNPELEQQAEQMCRTVAGRLLPALTDPRQQYLSEDYLVYAVYALDEPQPAQALLTSHRDEIASMLRGEREPLSEQETSTVMRHAMSYLADDVVIPTWNAAFVYDTPAGAQAALEIFEFANSQLLEYRYYDQRLDADLARIYGRLQNPRWYDQWMARRYTSAARQVHSLFIDVNELTDRSENTLKFIGDIYAARLFSAVGERLGLDRWKADVEAKLKTLDDIYRFAVDQSAISRGQFLELTIILILVLELVLILLGVMS